MKARGLEVLLATACGFLIANLYFGQPLLESISTSIGLPDHSRGLIVTLPLAGYGLGLLLVVPLGDLLENKRVVLLLVALEGVCVAALSAMHSAPAFLAIAFLAGAAASCVQLLVPYVTYIVEEAEQGRAVGKVVSGVMLGIMLARPVSSLVADQFSWRAIYIASATAMIVLFVGLRSALPSRRPPHRLSYGALLLSMERLYRSVPVVRQRGLLHACMFGAFSVFWTAVPLWLASPKFGLTQRGIAWVALAGVAGAVAPPLAGRMADRRLADLGTTAAMVLAAASFLLTLFARDGSPLSLALVVATAIVLDFAVSANLVFSQRAIYSLGAAERSRLNGLFMATFFVGGAVTSAMSGWAYARFGWPAVVWLGVTLPLLGLAMFTAERFRPATRVPG